MDNYISIEYSGFWDHPLGFVTYYQNLYWYFGREFDETADEYETEYDIIVLQHLPDRTDPNFWQELKLSGGQSLGTIPVRDIMFDSTRRAAIDSSILDKLLPHYRNIALKSHQALSRKNRKQHINVSRLHNCQQVKQDMNASNWLLSCNLHRKIITLPAISAAAEHVVADRPTGSGRFYESFLCCHMVTIYQPLFPDERLMPGRSTASHRGPASDTRRHYVIRIRTADDGSHA